MLTLIPQSHQEIFDAACHFFANHTSSFGLDAYNMPQYYVFNTGGGCVIGSMLTGWNTVDPEKWDGVGVGNLIRNELFHVDEIAEQLMAALQEIHDNNVSAGDLWLGDVWDELGAISVNFGLNPHLVDFYTGSVEERELVLV